MPLIISLVFVLLNMFASPGYLSLFKIETDRNIILLTILSSIIPIFLIVLFPKLIIEVIIGEIIYIIVGIYFTSRSK